MAFLAPAIAAVGGSMFSSAALLTAGASLGITAAKAMRKPQAPAPAPAPAAEAAPPKPQAAQKADRTAAVAANAAAAAPGGAMAGNSGTFLTGPEGVDPNSLNLGRNTLLGQ